MTTPRTIRRSSLSLLVALLLVTAGCSSLGGPSGDATPAGTNSTTPAPATPTEPATAQPTTPASTPTSTPTPVSTATPSTPAPETTAAESSDGHSHTDNATATENDTTTGGNDTAATGEMVVLVNGVRIDLGEAIEGSDSFRMAEGNTDAWHATGDHTLSSVLSRAGIDATASTLTYDGETYDEGNSGTDVVYRVDGQPVDPTSYTLQDGDEVWVLVLTDEMNFSTPGSYIPPDRLHVHGSMDFVVDGHSLDFSREKWQTPGHARYFHFEGDHAEPWHAHSATVTLAYGLSALEDINASERGITYNGTAYGYDGAGPSATVTVNGEPVDPTRYYLKDGDSVRIVLESDT